MGRSDEYRRFAAECLEIVRKSKDRQTRNVLLQMAQVWSRLANEMAEADRMRSATGDPPARDNSNQSR